MTTQTTTDSKDNTRTRRAREQMASMKALIDATTDQELRAELREEMNCVAMGWLFAEISADDADDADEDEMPGG